MCAGKKDKYKINEVCIFSNFYPCCLQHPQSSDWGFLMEVYIRISFLDRLILFQQQLTDAYQRVSSRFYLISAKYRIFSFNQQFRDFPRQRSYHFHDADSHQKMYAPGTCIMFEHMYVWPPSCPVPMPSLAVMFCGKTNCGLHSLHCMPFQSCTGVRGTMCYLF